MFLLGHFNSLLPGHKLEWPIFTTAHPIPGHERVNITVGGKDLFIHNPRKSIVLPLPTEHHEFFNTPIRGSKISIVSRGSKISIDI